MPWLFVAEPFSEGFDYSQLGITYLAAYFLGMLVLYHPTHWMSLVQGGNDDALWLTINRTQHFVETLYPELVIEMINKLLKQSKH